MTLTFLENKSRRQHPFRFTRATAFVLVRGKFIIFVQIGQRVAQYERGAVRAV